VKICVYSIYVFIYVVWMFIISFRVINVDRKMSELLETACKMFITKTKLLMPFRRNCRYLLEKSYEKYSVWKRKQRFSLLHQVAHSCHWTVNVEGYVWNVSGIDPTNRVRRSVLFCVKKDAGHFSILKIKLKEGSPYTVKLKNNRAVFSWGGAVSLCYYRL
jgi:hypothetical protein